MAINKLIISSIIYKEILHVAFGWQLWSSPDKKLISVTKNFSSAQFAFIFLLLCSFSCYFFIYFLDDEIFALIKLSSKYYNPYVLPVLFHSKLGKSRYFETAVTVPTYIEKRLTRKLQVQLTEGNACIGKSLKYFKINTVFSCNSCGMICWPFHRQGQLDYGGM